MQFIDTIMGIAMALSTLFLVYFGAITILGSLRKEKRCPRVAPCKRIAAIIAARNESGVIGQLVESILKQDYPRELMDVFVVPNNCTDDTEEVARRAGARILHCAIPVHAKGEAVSWTIDELLNYPEGYDGFIIVDADNLLDPGYFQCANDALCAGAQVGQGYRDSKNYTDSWIAGCSSLFYWFMSRFYNRTRSSLGMSAALNGTGILLSAEYMRRVGWHTTSLTEDLEFTAQCALNGVRIWWLGDAVAYDEQPNGFADSFKQRRRWAAGTVQCMKGYWVKLIRRAVKERSLQCLDMAVLFSGPIIQVISIIPGVYFFFRALIPMLSGPIGPVLLYLGGMAGSGVLSVLALALAAWLFMRLEHKQTRGQGKTIWTLWLFLLSWMPANLLGLFARPPKWVQIRHTRGMTMDEMNGSTETDLQERA